MQGEGYWDSFRESEYNLKEIQKAFTHRQPEFEYCLNNFLSSTQKIIWTLNYSFDKKPGYDAWQLVRGERLCPEAKIFKELRNISIKQKPIKHEGIILGFELNDSNGGGLPAHATFYGPTIDTRNGKPLSNKGTVVTKEGETYEVEVLTLNDFFVKVESGKKIYQIDQFITQATKYLQSMQVEILETEKRFKYKF